VIEKFQAPPVDKSRILGSRGERQQQLIHSVTIENEEEKRAAIVFLLEKRRLVRDEGEMQDLLGCSTKQIREARERASQAVRSDDALGKYIATRILEAQEQTPEAVTQPEAVPTMETAEKRLRSVAEQVFGLDAESIGGRERRSLNKLVNWSVVLIAQMALKKDRFAAAKIAGVEASSAERMITDAREEYAALGFFYNRVRKICTELGIPSPY